VFSSNVEHALAKEGRAQWSSWKKQVAGVLPAFLTSAIDKADVPLVVLFQRGNYLCKRCKATFTMKTLPEFGDWTLSQI
jgi:hypothetical protein